MIKKVYDNKIQSEIREMLIKEVHEQVIADQILEMTFSIEKTDIMEKINLVNKEQRHTTKKVELTLDLFIYIMENNIDIKIKKMRDILIDKMKDLKKNWSNIENFHEYSILQENKEYLEEENQELKAHIQNLENHEYDTNEDNEEESDDGDVNYIDIDEVDTDEDIVDTYYS